MINRILTFFQMQIESIGWDTIELLQSSFGLRPETFYSINVNITNSKNIIRMIDSQMFRITDLNQSVVTAPPIGMNHRIEVNFPTDNSLKGFLLHLRDDL